MRFLGLDTDANGAALARRKVCEYTCAHVLTFVVTIPAPHDPIP